MSDRTHFVYRFFDSDGRLLYIGCTKDIVRRLKNHRYDNQHFYHRIARITQQGPFTQQYALRLERGLIEQLRPDFNATADRRARFAEKRAWVEARTRELCGGKDPSEMEVQKYIRLADIARHEGEGMFPGIHNGSARHPQESAGGAPG